MRFSYLALLFIFCFHGSIIFDVYYFELFKCLFVCWYCLSGFTCNLLFFFFFFFSVCPIYLHCFWFLKFPVLLLPQWFKNNSVFPVLYLSNMESLAYKIEALQSMFSPRVGSEACGVVGMWPWISENTIITCSIVRNATYRHRDA